MTDLILLIYLVAVLYCAATGFGRMFGFFLTDRNKCWSSEGALKNEWARTNRVKYKEYFS